MIYRTGGKKFFASEILPKPGGGGAGHSTL